MKYFLSFIFALLAGSSPAADFFITGIVTITNATKITNGETIIVNADTRTWTNTVFNDATQILRRTNIAQNVQQLLIHSAQHPFLNVRASGDALTYVSYISKTNLPLTITISTTYGYVSYQTQTVGGASAVRVPYTVEAPTQQTNVASGVGAMLESSANTNRALSGFGLSNPTTTARLLVGGGLGYHGLLVATNYTLTTNDIYVGVDTTATNVDLTLPSAASASNLLFIIKDEVGYAATNGHGLNVYLSAGDRIDGVLTNLSITNNFSGAMLRSRGQTNWLIISSGGGISGGFGGGGATCPEITELVNNSGFELGLANWTSISNTPAPELRTNLFHSGTNSVFIGSTNTTEPDGDSALQQSFDLPIGQIGLLSFWEYSISTDTIAFDWQNAEIRNASGTRLQFLFKEARDAEAWEQRTFLIGPFAVTPVVLYLGAHEDGSTDPTGMYIDDVSLTTGNVGPDSLWVAAAYGNDTTGARGCFDKPFASLRHAKTNALAGDTIYVLPGVYYDHDLLKNGVNWHFFEGATVNASGGNGAIFDDGSSFGANATVTNTISGRGVFIATNGYEILSLNNAATAVYLSAKRLESSNSVIAFLNKSASLVIEDTILTNNNRYIFQSNSKTSRVDLARCRLDMSYTNSVTSTTFSPFKGTTTNAVILRDCVIRADPSEMTAGKVIDTGNLTIYGTLTANLPLGVVPFTAESVTVGGDLTVTATNYVGSLVVSSTASMPTNIAQVDVVTNDFVLGTRYTNETRRAFVAGSFTLSAAVAGTAQVALYVEHGPTTITNKAVISAGPLASLIEVGELFLPIGPGAIYYFSDETSGAGATVTVVADSCSVTKW